MQPSSAVSELSKVNTSTQCGDRAQEIEREINDFLLERPRQDSLSSRAARKTGNSLTRPTRHPSSRRPLSLTWMVPREGQQIPPRKHHATFRLRARSWSYKESSTPVTTPRLLNPARPRVLQRKHPRRTQQHLRPSSVPVLLLFHEWPISQMNGIVHDAGSRRSFLGLAACCVDARPGQSSAQCPPLSGPHDSRPISQALRLTPLSLLSLRTTLQTHPHPPLPKTTNTLRKTPILARVRCHPAALTFWEPS